MSVSVVACPAPILQFFDNAGNPAVGGSVLTQVSGVNYATYQDSAGNTPLPNPIPLNSRGEVSNAAGASCQLFIAGGVAYTFTLYDARGNLLNQSEYVNGTLLTQNVVGQLLYPQTAAEAADSIVPVAYYYDTDYIERQGAVANLSTDALGAVNDAILVNNRAIRSHDGDFKISAVPTNPNGIEFKGTGNLLMPITGGYQQLNSYADAGKYYFGKEYLNRVYKRLLSQVGTAQTINVFAYGDSTVIGGNGEDAAYRVGPLLEQMSLLAGLSLPLLVTNRGVSGAKITDMNALPDLGTSTDLFIIKYGINDGLNPLSTRLETFAASLRSQLAAIRAATNGDLSSLAIVLVGPNATSDSPNNRDERWYEQLRGVYVQAARDYHCMYFDTYAYLRDARPAAGDWMTNDYGDGRAIHPLDAMNAWIWGGVFRAIFSAEDLVYWRTNAFVSIPGNYQTLLPTVLPNSFTLGLSFYRALSSDSWPEDGVVLNIRHPDGPSMQLLFPYTSGRTVILQRIADIGGNAWNLWAGQANVLTLVNSWVEYGTPYGHAQATMDAQGIVTVNATIKSGTTTSGTTLTTLPAGMWPSAQMGPFLCAMSGGTCTVTVDTSGVVALTSAGNATLTSLQFSFRAL